MTKIQTKILIVGSGGNALSAASLLTINGVTDFRMITKDADFGGAWFTNTYPGSEVDVPCHVYQIGHAPGEWNRLYPSQKDLLAYFQDVGNEYGLYERADFGTELIEAEWIEDKNHWRVITSGSEYHAELLLLATGFLEEKVTANIPGMESFAGRIFHSADWPEGYTGENDRIAVVGSGSSACQIVPAMQKVAEKVIQFARTPSHVLPKGNRDLTPEEMIPENFKKRAVEVNAEWEGFVTALLGGSPDASEGAAAASLAFLEEEITDLELREMLTPSHKFGCKRPIFSDDYYKSLMQPNVEVIGAAASEITEQTITSADGRTFPVDTIVMATGFYFGGHILDRIKRRDGESVMSHQAGHPSSYKAVSVAGCPNLFLIGGAAPNGQGWNGMYSGEAVGRYVLSILSYMEQHNVASIEVKESAESAWKEHTDRLLSGSASLSADCVNYSQDDCGHNKAVFPGTNEEMDRQFSVFEPDDHLIVPAKEKAVHASSLNLH